MGYDSFILSVIAIPLPIHWRCSTTDTVITNYISDSKQEYPIWSLDPLIGRKDPHDQTIFYVGNERIGDSSAEDFKHIIQHFLLPDNHDYIIVDHTYDNGISISWESIENAKLLSEEVNHKYDVNIKPIVKCENIVTYCS